MAAFPSAEALLEIDEPIPGLTQREAACGCRASRGPSSRAGSTSRTCASSAPTRRLAELQELRGIGPFSSSLIVLRAVGFTDVLPVEQPLVQRAVEQAYAITTPLSPGAVRRARRAVAAVPHLGDRAHARRRRARRDGQPLGSQVARPPPPAATSLPHTSEST